MDLSKFLKCSDEWNGLKPEEKWGATLRLLATHLIEWEYEPDVKDFNDPTPTEGGPDFQKTTRYSYVEGDLECSGCLENLVKSFKEHVMDECRLRDLTDPLNM